MERELKSTRITQMMGDSEIAAIDEWRRKQPDLPSRSEAIRRLIDAGLQTYEAAEHYSDKTD